MRYVAQEAFCPQNTHTRTHAHAHSLSHTHTHTLSLSLALTRVLSRSRFLSFAHPHSLSFSCPPHYLVRVQICVQRRSGGVRYEATSLETQVRATCAYCCLRLPCDPSPSCLFLDELDPMLHVEREASLVGLVRGCCTPSTAS